MSSTHALIIEDNPDNLQILAQLLSIEGVTHTAIQDPTEVSSGLSGIDTCDVVFLDLELPKIDGYHLFGILQEALGKSVPIVAYTVHTSQMDTVRQFGFHGFLGKPLDLARFPGYLKDILAGKPVWEA